MAEDNVEIKFFTIPDGESATVWIVGTHRKEQMTKFQKAIMAVALINEQMDRGARSVHDAAEVVQNDLDLTGWAMRTIEAYYKAIKKYDEHNYDPNQKGATKYLEVRPGDEVVLPDDSEWAPMGWGKNSAFADYKTYAALVKAFPDGPRKFGEKPIKTVANKETHGHDQYAFDEQNHEWVETSYEGLKWDFDNLESLLEKYPDGYYEGEHRFEPKTFVVKGTVPGHPDMPRNFAWEQDWDSDDESEFKWTPRQIYDGVQIKNELELMWLQLKGLQAQIDMAYVADPEDFKLGMPGAAKFAEANGMIMEDLLNMLRAGSESHVSYLLKPDESSHVPEGREPLELERSGDWDDALARLLAQQDQQETPDDAEQS